jgi:hypothetical protein
VYVIVFLLILYAKSSFFGRQRKLKLRPLKIVDPCFLYILVLFGYIRVQKSETIEKLFLMAY